MTRIAAPSTRQGFEVYLKHDGLPREHTRSQRGEGEGERGGMKGREGIARQPPRYFDPSDMIMYVHVHLVLCRARLWVCVYLCVCVQGLSLGQPTAALPALSAKPSPPRPSKLFGSLHPFDGYGLINTPHTQTNACIKTYLVTVRPCEHRMRWLVGCPIQRGASSEGSLA